MTAEAHESDGRSRALRYVVDPVRAWGRELIVLDNPFAIRDARSRVRGMRFPLLLLAYHAATLLFGLIGVLVYRASQGGSADVSAGRVVFPYLAYTQIILAPMVATAFTATAMTSEREKQSLDLLTVTTLRGIEVALGKAAIPWALTFLVAATSLPYTLFCSIAGGISLGQIATFYVGLALFCGLLASLGIMLSSMSRSSVLAVILAVAIYLVGLIASLVMMVVLEELKYGAPPGGEILTATLGFFPTTWVAALLEPEVASFWLAGVRIPFWIPGVLLWGTAIAYMLLVASCRAGTSHARHLTARRVAGYICWLALLATLTVVWFGTLMPGAGLSRLFVLLGQSGVELTVLLIMTSWVACLAAIVAANAALGECEAFAARPIARLAARALALPRVLSPTPEGGLPFAVFVWASGLALVLVGVVLASAGALPLRWDVIATLLVPQIGAILYCGFAGLWANLKYGGGTRNAKNAAVALVAPLILWPLIAQVATMAATSSMLAGPLRSTIMRAGAFATGLSPLSYGPLVGLSGRTEQTYLDLWIGQTHPAHLAGAMSLILACIMGLALFSRAARTRATAPEYAGVPYRNTGPAQGVQEESVTAPHAEPGGAE